MMERTNLHACELVQPIDVYVAETTGTRTISLRIHQSKWLVGRKVALLWLN